VDATTSLLTVTVVLALAWIGGRAARLFGQPAVIGELAAGLVLGPSVLGALSPQLSARIFTPDSTAMIGELAEAAVLLFMFLVGLELDTAILRRHAGGVARIAVVNLLVPFAIGSGLALWLYPSMHGDVENRVAFVLFAGTALSITAMPVLTRILTDWRMLGTTIGAIAVGCAAIDDVAAWTMLGFVAGLIRGQSTAAWLVTMGAVYLAVMLLGVRPILTRLAAARRDAFGRVLWILTLATMAVVSSMATDRIGIHAVFGSFLAGACVPRRAAGLDGLAKPLHQASAILLPAFFVLVGLRTQAGLLNGAANWAVVAALVVCASAGKLGGGALAARTLGFSWRDALALGALLNTRGLVALVALDTGRSVGILSPELFAMGVAMTFVTTLATVPILRALGFRPIAPATPGGRSA